MPKNTNTLSGTPSPLTCPNQRQIDTRRKILIGAYTIQKARQQNNLKALYQEISTFLTRDIDKQLFDDSSL